jgi:hypothetical protein
LPTFNYFGLRRFCYRTAFSKENTVLIFHLKNHYALIFALREWALPPPKDDDASSSPSTSTFVADLRHTCCTANKPEVQVVRQILCARKGQRPTAWVDFDEARETMLSWEGYKIMAITLSREQAVPSLQGVEQLVVSKAQQLMDEFTRQLVNDQQSPSHSDTISLMNNLALLPSHY